MLILIQVLFHIAWSNVIVEDKFKQNQCKTYDLEEDLDFITFSSNDFQVYTSKDPCISLQDACLKYPCKAKHSIIGVVCNQTTCNIKIVALKKNEVIGLDSQIIHYFDTEHLILEILTENKLKNIENLVIETKMLSVDKFYEYTIELSYDDKSISGVNTNIGTQQIHIDTLQAELQANHKYIIYVNAPIGAIVQIETIAFKSERPIRLFQKIDDYSNYNATQVYKFKFNQEHLFNQYLNETLVFKLKLFYGASKLYIHQGKNPMTLEGHHWESPLSNQQYILISENERKLKKIADDEEIYHITIYSQVPTAYELSITTSEFIDANEEVSDSIQKDQVIRFVYHTTLYSDLQFYAFGDIKTLIYFGVGFEMTDQFNRSDDYLTADYYLYMNTSSLQQNTIRILHCGGDCQIEIFLFGKSSGNYSILIDQINQAININQNTLRQFNLDMDQSRKFNYIMDKTDKYLSSMRLEINVPYGIAQMNQTNLQRFNTYYTYKGDNIQEVKFSITCLTQCHFSILLIPVRVKDDQEIVNYINLQTEQWYSFELNHTLYLQVAKSKSKKITIYEEEYSGYIVIEHNKNIAVYITDNLKQGPPGYANQIYNEVIQETNSVIPLDFMESQELWIKLQAPVPMNITINYRSFSQFNFLHINYEETYEQLKQDTMQFQADARFDQTLVIHIKALIEHVQLNVCVLINEKCTTQYTGNSLSIPVLKQEDQQLFVIQVKCDHDITYKILLLDISPIQVLEVDMVQLVYFQNTTLNLVIPIHQVMNELCMSITFDNNIYVDIYAKASNNISDFPTQENFEQQLSVVGSDGCFNYKFFQSSYILVTLVALHKVDRIGRIQVGSKIQELQVFQYIKQINHELYMRIRQYEYKSLMIHTRTGDNLILQFNLMVNTTVYILQGCQVHPNSYEYNWMLKLNKQNIFVIQNITKGCYRMTILAEEEVKLTMKWTQTNYTIHSTVIGASLQTALADSQQFYIFPPQFQRTYIIFNQLFNTVKFQLLENIKFEDIYSSFQLNNENQSIPEILILEPNDLNSIVKLSFIKEQQYSLIIYNESRTIPIFSSVVINQIINKDETFTYVTDSKTPYYVYLNAKKGEFTAQSNNQINTSNNGYLEFSLDVGNQSLQIKGVEDINQVELQFWQKNMFIDYGQVMKLTTQHQNFTINQLYQDILVDLMYYKLNEEICTTYINVYSGVTDQQIISLIAQMQLSYQKFKLFDSSYVISIFSECMNPNYIFYVKKSNSTDRVMIPFKVQLPFLIYKNQNQYFFIHVQKACQVLIDLQGPNLQAYASQDINNLYNGVSEILSEVVNGQFHTKLIVSIFEQGELYFAVKCLSQECDFKILVQQLPMHAIQTSDWKTGDIAYHFDNVYFSINITALYHTDKLELISYMIYCNQQLVNEQNSTLLVINDYYKNKLINVVAKVKIQDVFTYIDYQPLQLTVTEVVKEEPQASSQAIITILILLLAIGGLFALYYIRRLKLRYQLLLQDQNTNKQTLVIQSILPATNLLYNDD